MEHAYEGCLDCVLDGSIEGWAWRPETPDEPISVDLYVDGELEAAHLAAGYRADLETAGKGTGRHAFRIPLLAHYRDGATHVIQVRCAGTALELHGSPVSVCVEPPKGLRPDPAAAARRARLDADVRARLEATGQAPPRVSVVVPCFNLGAYIDEAVDSVLEQTFQDFEIIVVNDGSTDHATNERLNAFDRPRTRVIATENRGLAAARNLGIAEARGRYICALDADDMLCPTYLEKAVRLLEADPSLSFVSSWLENFGEESWTWTQEHCDLPTLLNECTVCTAALVRTTALRAVGGYDEGMPEQGYEDWDLWIGLVERGYVGTIIPEVLFRYRRRQGSMSSICCVGDGHEKLLRYIVGKHFDSYRRHYRDVLLRKEAATAAILKSNLALETDIETSLVPEVSRRRDELDRLRRKLHAAREESALRSERDRLAERVKELETRLAAHASAAEIGGRPS